MTSRKLVAIRCRKLRKELKDARQGLAQTTVMLQEKQRAAERLGSANDKLKRDLRELVCAQADRCLMTDRVRMCVMIEDRVINSPDVERVLTRLVSDTLRELERRHEGRRINLHATRP